MLDGSSITLYVEDAETLDNVSISFGSGSYSSNLTGTALTLGSAASLSTGSSGYGYLSGTSITSFGTIAVTANTLYANATTLTNVGTVTVTGSGGWFNESGTTFTNSGLLAIAAGATAELNNTTFSNSGTITVAAGGTLDLLNSYSLASLGSIVVAAGGVVAVAGSLDLGGGTLDVAAGSEFGNLVETGTLSNGTLKLDGGTFTEQGATFNNLTVLGPLVIASSLNVTGGLMVESLAGTTPGSILFTGSNSSLNVQDTETLDNVSITFGASSVYGTIAATTLTLGAGATLNANASNYAYLGGSVVTNRGRIAVTTALYEGATAFTNAGTIAVSGVGFFDAYGYLGTGTFTNTGLLTIGAGATAEFGNSTSLANTGTITVAAGATLELAGSYSLASLGSIVVAAGGVIDLTGTLNLGGSTISLAPGSGLDDLQVNGLLMNGTVLQNGGTLTASGGTLDAIKLQGTVAATYNSTVYVEGGLTATGAGDAIDLTSTYGSSLNVLDSETLDGAAISFGSQANITAAASLTLGAHTQVQGIGNTINFDSVVAGSAITNAGTITVLDGQLNVDALSFINTGTILFGAGEGLSIGYSDAFQNKGLFDAVANSGVETISAGGGRLSNLAATTLSGGTFEVDEGTTLDLNIGNTITTDASTIVLSGPDSSLLEFNGTAYVGLESSLTSVAASGALKLLAGRSWNGKSLTDSGSIVLGGGVFTAPVLNVSSTGTLFGFGTVAASLGDAGTIQADGGNLLLTATPTGTGGQVIDAGSTLELATASADAVTFNGLGARLRVDVPGSYTGTLTSVAAGDALMLQGVSATSATSSGTTLTVNLTGGTTETFTTSAALTGIREGVTQDGLGNSQVVFYRYASPAAEAPNPVVFGNHHVGDTVTQALTLSNAAATDGYSEALDGSLSGATGAITTSGTVALLAPGAANSTGLTVSLVTATAGAKTGSATINLATDGNGIDGNASLALPSQTVTATGAVFNYATAVVVPNPVAFGNHHVGDLVTQAVTLGNGAVSGAYSENLNAAFTGASASLTDSGSVSELAAYTASAALGLTLATGVAGAITGTATLALVSDGSTIDGLGTTVLAPVVISAGGSVFNYATAVVVPNPVAFGNHHVGDLVAQAVTLGNGAAAGGYSENLDAAFASAAGGLLDSGSVAELGAGVASTALRLTLATGIAGAISGSATLGVSSDGSTIDGLGTTALAALVIAGSGSVFNYATATVAPNPVAFGNHHVGDTVTQAVTLGNGAAAGAYSEKLAAVFSGAAGGLTDSGSVSGLAAGSHSAALALTLATGVAGAISGSATLALTSDGTGIDGLGTTALAPDVITGSGSVFSYATASLAPNPVTFGKHHVGDVVSQAVTLGNSAASSGYSEALDAAFSSASGGLTDSGSIAGLAAGASSSALRVTLATGIAGAISGSATLGLASDGGTIDGLGTTALAAAVLTGAGSVYNYATASVAPNPVAFGNHHVGDAVTQAVTLANTAAAGAYSENLDAAFTGASGGLLDSGSVAGLAAGASTSILTLALATGVAGAIGGSATLGLASDGGTIDGLGTGAGGDRRVGRGVQPRHGRAVVQHHPVRQPPCRRHGGASRHAVQHGSGEWLLGEPGRDFLRFHRRADG